MSHGFCFVTDCAQVYKKKLAEERTQLAEELRILKEKEGEQAMRQKEIESLKASLQEAKEKVDNDLATLRKEVIPLY